MSGGALNNVGALMAVLKDQLDEVNGILRQEIPKYPLGPRSAHAILSMNRLNTLLEQLGPAMREIELAVAGDITWETCERRIVAIEAAIASRFRRDD